MKIKALGKYIHLEKEPEEQTTSSGILIPKTGPNKSGTQAVLKKGKVLSMGKKAKEELPDLKPGDEVFYNPFDTDDADGEIMLDVAGVQAKVC